MSARMQNASALESLENHWMGRPVVTGAKAWSMTMSINREARNVSRLLLGGLLMAACSFSIAHAQSAADDVLPAVSNDASPVVATVNASDARLRCTPSADAFSPKLLASNEPLTVLSIKGDWACVRLPADVECWVDERSVELRDGAWWVSGSADLRITPDTRYNAVATLGSLPLTPARDADGRIVVNNGYLRIVPALEASAWVQVTNLSGIDDLLDTRSEGPVAVELEIPTAPLVKNPMQLPELPAEALQAAENLGEEIAFGAANLAQTLTSWTGWFGRTSTAASPTISADNDGVYDSPVESFGGYDGPEVPEEAAPKAVAKPAAANQPAPAVTNDDDTSSASEVARRQADERATVESLVVRLAEELKKPVAEQNLDRIKLLFTSFAETASFDAPKATALEKAGLIEKAQTELEAARKRDAEARALAEERARKAEEARKKAEEIARSINEKKAVTWLASGVVGDHGRDAVNPASHALLDPATGEVLYYIRWDGGNLDKLWQKRVRIAGPVTTVKGWDKPIVAIEACEEGELPTAQAPASDATASGTATAAETPAEAK